MARAVAESVDFVNRDFPGVIDFSNLSTGGDSVQPVSEREGWNFNKAEDVAAYERFMREPVVIVINTTGSKNEPPVAEVAVNGVKAIIPRERPVRIPRAFVEVLARSQERTYSQQDNPDREAMEGKVTRRHVSPGQYPFTVRHDPNPKGAAWLSRVVHESA